MEHYPRDKYRRINEDDYQLLLSVLRQVKSDARKLPDTYWPMMVGGLAEALGIIEEMESGRAETTV